VTAGVAAAQPHHTSSSFSAELAAATAHAGTASARKEFETRRSVRTSRSEQRHVESQRHVVIRTKAHHRAEHQQTKSQGQVTHTQDLASQDPRTVAQALMPQFGFSSDQFSCLDALWNRESGWNPHAMNASSGAYGIPQSLPGSKMAAAGGDWQTNPATQIKWGLGYIKASYGSPCGAWAHSESYGWY